MRDQIPVFAVLGLVNMPSRGRGQRVSSECLAPTWLGALHLITESDPCGGGRLGCNRGLSGKLKETVVVIIPRYFVSGSQPSLGVIRKSPRVSSCHLYTNLLRAPRLRNPTSKKP